MFFDTCVYHQPGIDLLTRVIPVDNILFASEMIGAVRGIDPETGHYFDDTKRYIEASSIVVGDDRHKIYEGNARRVFRGSTPRSKSQGEVSEHVQPRRRASATSCVPTRPRSTSGRRSAWPRCTRRWAASA